MLRSDEILDQHKQDLEARFFVRRIGLFGSVLRGSASDRSDVDILVELAHPTFDQYMDLKFFLCRDATFQTVFIKLGIVRPETKEPD